MTDVREAHASSTVELSPLLIVFGVACLGVLVEAFVPRAVPLPRPGRARPRSASSPRSSAVVLVAQDVQTCDDGAARGVVAAEGAIAVDGPALFIWGLILVLALVGVLLFAERHLEGGVTAFAGQAAALPGTEAEREALAPRASSTPRSSR